MKSYKRGTKIQIDPRILREERESTLMTQNELAERSNLTRVGYCNIENTGVAHDNTIQRILDVLNMPIKRGDFITRRVTNLNIDDLIIKNELGINKK